MENPKDPGGTQKEEEGQGASGTRPYVLIATNFWFQPSSVAKNFVYDNSKSQEINKNDQARRSYEAPNEVVFSAQPAYFGGTIVLVSQGRRESDDHGWAEIAKDVEVLVQKPFVVDDPHDDEVQVYAFNAHPGEGRQEEVMKQPSDHGADQLICVDVDPNKKDKFCKEKAATEVLVNCGPSALNFTEEPEGENTHGKANQGDNYPKLSDPCQDIIIFNSNGGTRRHQNCEVCQVTAAAGGVGVI